jgi:hypothetical protein
MFTLHSIRLVGSSSVLVKCAKGHNLAMDAQEESTITAGSFYPRFISILSVDSKISFSSFAIDQIAGLTGLIGTAIGSGETYTSAELYFARYDVYGRLISGSNHVKATITRGFLSWNSITSQTNQNAEIACDLHAIDPDSAGILPVVIATSIALPSPSAVDDTRFALKSATLGGVAIDCVQSVNINANRTVEFRRCNSDVYAKFLRSSPIKPTINVTTQDSLALSSGKIPFTGKVCANADTAIWLRKRLNNQIGYVADDQSAHIKIAASGLARIQDHQSTVPDPGTATIMLNTIDDGTNAPVVITTGAAMA